MKADVKNDLEKLVAQQNNFKKISPNHQLLVFANNQLPGMGLPENNRAKTLTMILSRSLESVLFLMPSFFKGFSEKVCMACNTR